MKFELSRQIFEKKMFKYKISEKNPSGRSRVVSCGWMDGWMDGWTDGQIDRGTDGQTWRI